MRGADPVRSATFRLLTGASPEAVWGCLTSPARSPRYLHGLTIETTWEPGAPVRLTAGVHPPLTGHVLHIAAGRQLSLTVEDVSDSCTYLTWTLREYEGGTVVRLHVQESGGDSTSDEDLEDVWLPVLDRLGDLLLEETHAG
jgi:uncharacterized protein YndB with AHSA1/START domain